MRPLNATLCHRRRKNHLLGIVAVVWAISTTVQSAWQAPLSENERNIAQSIALPPQTDEITGLRSSSPTPAHPLGIQVLLIEPKEQKKTTNSNAKMVEVFTFDHNTHAAERTLVNLTMGTISHSQTINGIHLPLSDEEIEFAINAVRNDLNVYAKLQKEHAAQGHTETDDVMSDLQLRVSIWVPLSAEHEGVSGCIHERCALISIFDKHNVSYAIEPVVKLKTSEVLLDAI